MASLDFDFEYRRKRIGEIDKEDWDLIVIGGGITGAAVARDAALRGLKTLLLEADDFASGTSSGSSKLLHGGIRYLEQFEFKLVRDAIHEREILSRLYAPLVEDLDFVFPTYQDGFPPRWKLNLGLHLYDAFSGFRVHHQNLNTSQTLGRYPQLRADRLTGSCVYVDSFAEDYRLVIELIKSAHRSGATCLSRMKVIEIDGSSVGCQLVAENRWQGSERIQLKSRFIFNCSGPFSDQVRGLLKLDRALELTQGVHFITKRENLPITTAFVMPDSKLHRILFAIPWKSMTYFGTTDTVIQDPSKARATSEDFKYCVGLLNQYFKVSLTRKDIIQSWAAVRPLIKPKDAKSPSAISREHHIEESPKRIFHILGGKLTSHRLMASEALELLSEYRSMPRCMTDQKKLLATTDHLKIDNLKDRVAYSIRHEMALTPLDFLRRRSSLYYEFPTDEMAKSVASQFEMILPASKGLEEVQKSYDWDQGGF